MGRLTAKRIRSVTAAAPENGQLLIHRAPVTALCIFSSWARRHHHLQKHALTGDLKQLWENIQEVFWNGLDTDMINRSWQNLVWTLRRVVELKGGNHVTMKHLTAAERLALLPPI